MVRLPKNYRVRPFKRLGFADFRSKSVSTHTKQRYAGRHKMYWARNKHKQCSEWGTAVAQWLRSCATNRKVAGSFQMASLEFFIDIKSFRSYYGTGVDSTYNRNEYQEYFLGVKTAGA